MELMSLLLLWTGAVFTPQVLGESLFRSIGNNIIGYNNTLKFRQNPTNKRILLNLNPVPHSPQTHDFQSAFTDGNCKDCLNCMNRAMKDNKPHMSIAKVRSSIEELPENAVNFNEIPRDKRETDPMKPEDATKTKKSKSKKSKGTKTVTVTKYNVDGEVTALKVKEANTQFLGEHLNDSTCQVYSIKQSYPCESPEGESILTAVKRKVNKKNKKESKKAAVTTERTKLILAAFRKREVDSAHMPDTFMPSIEELY